MTSFGPFHTEWVRFNPKPNHVTEKLRLYWNTLPSRPYDSVYSEALYRAEKDYTLVSKIKPYHINDAIRRYPHPERSPGLPHTTNGL